MPEAVIADDQMKIPVDVIAPHRFHFTLRSGLKRFITFAVTNNLKQDLRPVTEESGTQGSLDVLVIGIPGQQRNVALQKIPGDEDIEGYRDVMQQIVDKAGMLFPGLQVGGVVAQFLSQYDNVKDGRIARWDPDGAAQGRNSLRLEGTNWVEDTTADGISSFEVFRDLVIAARRANPELKRIIVAGHSAGAIFASHLAVTPLLDHPDLKGLDIVYMPANASNVPNLNELTETSGRPLTRQDVSERLRERGLTRDTVEAITSDEEFAISDDWPTGVGGNLPPVLQKLNMDREDFRTTAARHTIVGIAGMHDDQWSAGLGVRLSRLLLGMNRKERMVNWIKHISTVTQEARVNAEHGSERASEFGDVGLCLVPGAKHKAMQVFANRTVLKRMFDGLTKSQVPEHSLAQ